MNDGTVLVNQNLLVPVILLGLVLWAVFIWKEWSQRKENRFWVKLVVAFLAIASLAMIALKPGTWQESTSGKGIVLTDGYRPAQLDSLRSIYKRIQIEEYTKGTPLSILKDVDSLFLLGHGLAPFDFWQVKNESVAFLGGEEVSGWMDISYKTEISLGEVLSVNAKYYQPKEGHWAILTDNGDNPLDSLLFEKGQEQVLQFNAKPKADGQFVYHLLEKNNKGNIVSDELLPIQVLEGERLKVLIVNTFPTFETKYLKNFLAEKGHEVLARTQLTKGKYKFEYFNGASNPIYGFTKANLELYDLLVIDTDSYTSLGRSSKNAMQEAVKNNGLGIFIQPNESLFRLAENESPLQFNRDFITETSLGESGQTLQKYPYSFEQDVRVQEILVDSLVVAAYIPVEKGKMGTTVLQNTYQLVLDGSDRLYASIWSQILNTIVREQDRVVEWKAVTQIPRSDQPFEFELRTSLNNLEVKTDGGANIPLLQDGLVSSKWTGIVYPRTTGWSKLEVSNDSTPQFTYYVFDEDQRESVTRSGTLEANLREFGTQNNFSTSVSTSKKTLKPISPFWFYALLLLCLGWLWLEPKLFKQAF
ncbi:hypothetical protein Murru_2864 [Allomuricauda ruestringensis DSM 13258]|uniref:Aerotolerance regulator N-terminal domain-containing protein n=1 Tax=Allomuricauda ruestringensis (strain DSM 13258 / CIP 107369 / LMG 19739 / B1) TaxID=886377 RepID=G2PJ67_ALLRU|nr:hypothetical protein [Allomuricauda ruestringensis]AEM71888.1 hypothetical protein Murru_2864 [Allomuricauda ruestringensis DSM 13258]